LKRPLFHAHRAGAAALALLAFGAGCRSAEERSAALRARYQVVVDGFVVRQQPAASRLAQEVVLDLAVGLAADPDGAEERLDVLTVDLVQRAADGAERRRFQTALPVAEAVPGGAPVRVSHRLPEVDYRPGDRFTVEVTGPRPPNAAGRDS
jgi:hypothetical protein